MSIDNMIPMMASNIYSDQKAIDDPIPLEADRLGNSSL